jgi:phosphoglucosamine mutase
MSNIGLDRACEAMGIALHKTQVGDKHVRQAMHEHGAVLGGEQSGHIIYLDHHTTGDGLFTAVQLLNAVVGRQAPLADLARVLHKFPQVLINTRLPERCDPLLHAQVRDAIQAAEACLGKNGRVLVRLSGTEPVARVMVEGPDQGTIESLAQQIVQAIMEATEPASAHRSLRP